MPSRLSILRRPIMTTVLAILAHTCIGCMPEALLIVPVSRRKALAETTFNTDWPWTPKIAIIDVNGVLTTGRGLPIIGSGENQVSFLTEKLDRARSDRNVKAVVLRINSPGGSVTASELMHREIRHFRNATGKPVVAVMMDVAASGGYYIASACDEIVAHPSTVTGSIGVIMQLFDVTGTMRMIGVTPNTIKSGDQKGGGSPFEELSPRQRDVFQSAIDDFYAQFVAAVDEGRPELTEERVRALADGRIYTASQALEVGLIDEIGSLRETIAKLRKNIDAGYVRLVTYHRTYASKPNIYAVAPTTPTNGNGGAIHVQLPDWLHQPQARFMYLWAP